MRKSGLRVNERIQGAVRCSAVQCGVAAARAAVRLACVEAGTEVQRCRLLDGCSIQTAWLGGQERAAAANGGRRRQGGSVPVITKKTTQWRLQRCRRQREQCRPARESSAVSWEGVAGEGMGAGSKGEARFAPAGVSGQLQGRSGVETLRRLETGTARIVECRK